MTADHHTTRRAWLGLAVLCSAFFMVILDVAIVNVALPTIQADLGMSAADLQWIVSAYALAFGGLLLLGGRVADLLGRRRCLMAGVLVFAGASLVAGLAGSGAVLIAARAAQGAGAALMTPAALAILMEAFPEGRPRNTALGVWGAVGASGGTAGVLLGGVLTETAGWEWIFLINVPVGLAVAAVAPALLDESRASVARRRFDLAGALAVTAGVSTLVYALVEAHDAGWTSARTAGLMAASAVLLGAFVVIERRAEAPLLPVSIFRVRAVTGANLAGFALSGAMLGMIFILTLHMQGVLGYTALETGLAWLAMSVAALVTAVAASAVVTRTGPRGPLVTGLLVAAAGLALLCGLSPTGGYVTDLLPGLLVFGAGLGLAFVAMSIGALEGVGEGDSGLASGLNNTAQQVGGALGVAILATVALGRTEDGVAAGVDPAVAMTGGARAALVAAALLAGAGAIAARALIRATPSAPAGAGAAGPLARVSGRG